MVLRNTGRAPRSDGIVPPQCSLCHSHLVRVLLLGPSDRARIQLVDGPRPSTCHRRPRPFGSRRGAGARDCPCVRIMGLGHRVPSPLGTIDHHGRSMGVDLRRSNRLRSPDAGWTAHHRTWIEGGPGRPARPDRLPRPIHPAGAVVLGLPRSQWRIAVHRNHGHLPVAMLETRP